MTREEVKVEFAGLTHDHLMVSKQDHTHQSQAANGMQKTTAATTMISSQDDDASAQSTIAILRRHPMYDSLVLVKRFRACLNGYSLEFPTSDVNNSKHEQQTKDCLKTKLVSVFLDGDDPIFQSHERQCKEELLTNEGDIVHVPMNGLLDRLDSYDRHGVSIDSRVYAFAMGMKTAEKFLTTCSMKEIQETPPL